MVLTEFAQEYLKLGLRINKHIKGYVEHYYGPKEVWERIDHEVLTSPKKLDESCQWLLKNLDTQGFELKRAEFLYRTLKAIETMVQKLNGDSISYLEQVQKFFNIKPDLIDETELYKLVEEAEYLYPGKEKIENRMEQYAIRRKVEERYIIPLCSKGLDVVYNRFLKIFPHLLPPEQKITFKMVKNVTWSLYNWYLGGFASRIDINGHVLNFWTGILDDLCHEAYPGHHTERCVKEKILFRDKEYFETSILIVYTPEMVISEGIGKTASRILFSNQEIAQLSLNLFCPNPKEEDPDILMLQQKVRNAFHYFDNNLTYYKYVEGWDEQHLIDYAKSFKIIVKRKIKDLLNFISDEFWAPYIPIYISGSQLIEHKLKMEDKIPFFRKLLSEQVLPSDLR